MAVSELVDVVRGADLATDFLRSAFADEAPGAFELAETGASFAHDSAPPVAEREAPFGGGANAMAAALIDHAPDRVRDAQLLELLGYLACGKTTPGMGDRLIARFGSLGATLAADRRTLSRELGLPDAMVTTLKTVQHTMERVLREPLAERPIIGSMQSLRDYLSLAMANEPNELVRILFLDRKNYLLSDEVVARGTIDHTPLYPREVLKLCIDKGAAAIVMVHNHPSGDPEPSRLDVEMTAQLERALRALDIVFHDHVVIGKRRHVSFRERGLLG